MVWKVNCDSVTRREGAEHVGRSEDHLIHDGGGSKARLNYVAAGSSGIPSDRLRGCHRSLREQPCYHPKPLAALSSDPNDFFAQEKCNLVREEQTMTHRMRPIKCTPVDRA